MDIELLKLYFQYLAPSLSVILEEKVSIREEESGIMVSTDSIDVYVSEDEVRVMRTDIEELESTGSYPIANSFDFIRVFAQVMAILFSVDVIGIIDTLVFKKTETWVDFIKYMASLFEIETTDIENGVLLEEVGEFTQDLDKDCLTLNTIHFFQFEFSLQDNGAKSFKEAVLTLLSSAMLNANVIEAVLYSIAPDEAETELEQEDNEMGDIEGGDDFGSIDDSEEVVI